MTDRVLDALFDPDPAAAKRWIVAWGSVGGWLRRWAATLAINLMGLRHA